MTFPPRNLIAARPGSQIHGDPMAGGPHEANARRLHHALETIRDAHALDAEALRTIAYAVVGPGAPRLMWPPPEPSDG